MKKYIITGACDPYHAHSHFCGSSNQPLRYDMATPVEWVVDDNYGYGYSIEEAYDLLDSYANQMSDDICYNNDEWIKQLVDEAKEYDEVDLDVSWYKGAGWYCGETLIYQRGDAYLRDDSMLYTIVAIDECEGYDKDWRTK